MFRPLLWDERTFSKSFEELQAIGDIDASLNKDEFTKKAYVDLEGVPDSVTYDKETGKFTTQEK